MQHGTCPRDELIAALPKSAKTRGCAPDKILLMRLGEMQRRIVRALGEGEEV